MRRLLSFVALLGVVACQSSPTGPEVAAAEIRPLHSTGDLGSGDRADSASTASSALAGSGYRDGSAGEPAAPASSTLIGSGY